MQLVRLLCILCILIPGVALGSSVTTLGEDYSCAGDKVYKDGVAISTALVKRQIKHELVKTRRKIVLARETEDAKRQAVLQAKVMKLYETRRLVKSCVSGALLPEFDPIFASIEGHQKAYFTGAFDKASQIAISGEGKISFRKEGSNLVGDINFGNSIAIHYLLSPRITFVVPISYAAFPLHIPFKTGSIILEKTGKFLLTAESKLMVAGSFRGGVIEGNITLQAENATFYGSVTASKNS